VRAPVLRARVRRRVLGRRRERRRGRRRRAPALFRRGGDALLPARDAAVAREGEVALDLRLGAWRARLAARAAPAGRVSAQRGGDRGTTYTPLHVFLCRERRSVRVKSEPHCCAGGRSSTRSRTRARADLPRTCASAPPSLHAHTMSSARSEITIARTRLQVPVQVRRPRELGGALRAQLRLRKHGHVPGVPPQLFGHADRVPLDLRPLRRGRGRRGVGRRRRRGRDG
jgi:hypothetical protein